MNVTLPNPADLRPGTPLHQPEMSTLGGSSVASAVSWAAIFAGAAAAAALSLILLILGTGLGLSSVSPWSGQGATSTALGVSTIAWLTFTQLAASGMGGYLAGRLRTKWAAVHTDEVYFRDTAHGFLAWAVATLSTAALLTSVIGSILGTGAQAGAAITGSAVSTAATGAMASGIAASRNDSAAPNDGGQSAGLGYFIDSLFRKDMNAAPAPATAASGGSGESATGATGATSTPGATGMTGGMPSSAGTAGASNAEVARIFANDLSSGTLSAEDARYVGQMVAQRTGLSALDAEKRVNDTFAKVQTKLKDAQATARVAADKARKASAGTALWLFVSLLIGAFVASLAATFGGRRRDF